METPEDSPSGSVESSGGSDAPDTDPVTPDLAPPGSVPDLAPAEPAAELPMTPLLPIVPPTIEPPAIVPPVAQPPIAPPPPTQAWTAPAEPVGPAPGFAFGGPGERLVAYIVDTLVITGRLILVLLAGALFAVIAAAATFLIWTIGGIGVILGYFPYFWVKGGQTPGLKLFGMRVVRDRDGGPVGLGSALLRLFGLYVVDGLVLYIGFIWIFIDKRNRCWHDLIAGTVVVKRA